MNKGILFTPELREKLCPGVIGPAMQKVAAVNFAKLYAKCRRSDELAEYLGRSVGWVNKTRRRLGIPSKFDEDPSIRKRQILDHPVELRGETKPVSVWCHEIFVIPPKQATRIVSICLLRKGRGRKGRDIFAPIAGVKYKEGVLTWL